MPNIKSVVTCHDIQGQLYQVEAAQLTFRPAIYGIVMKDNQVLLSQQWDGYDFPGGAIELGETLMEALTREVKEETGLTVEAVNPSSPIYAQGSFFKMPFKGNYVQAVHMYFLCRVKGGELSTKYFDEHEKDYAQLAQWFKLEELAELNFCSSLEINDLLANLKSAKTQLAQL